MFAASACGGNYYQVTDVSSSKTYQPRGIDHENGPLQFTDKAGDDEVSLDKSSESLRYRNR